MILDKEEDYERKDTYWDDVNISEERKMFIAIDVIVSFKKLLYFVNKNKILFVIDWVIHL